MMNEAPSAYATQMCARGHRGFGQQSSCSDAQGVRHGYAAWMELRAEGCVFVSQRSSSSSSSRAIHCPALGQCFGIGVVWWVAMSVLHLCMH